MKEAYTPPTIVDYGDLVELTAVNNSTDSADVLVKSNITDIGLSKG